jgi:hypothetical protein
MPNKSAGLDDDFVKSDGLLNVERIALEELLTSGESALEIAVRRVIVELDGENDGAKNFAEFNNAP